jgi:hypothetical protein
LSKPEHGCPEKEKPDRIRGRYQLAFRAICVLAVPKELLELNGTPSVAVKKKGRSLFNDPEGERDNKTSEGNGDF